MSALLALFIRSLRELLRSKMSYWMLSATVGLIFLFLLGASAGATATTAPGLKFFHHSLFIVVAFITLAGVSYFASAITEEKEEGTLGLLRMTDLNPLGILLGKGTSRLGGALLLLVATMPFTLLAITLGGVSARQVLASYLCLGAYLVLLANLALLVSVLSPRGAIASAVMSGLVFGGSAIGALLGAMPAWFAKLPFVGARLGFLAPAFSSVSGVIDTVNPFRRLGAVLTTGFSGAVVDEQFGWSLALAAACLCAAWLVFDLATGEGAPSATPRLVPRPGSRWQRFAPGRAWLVSALAWKDFHFLHGGRFVVSLKWIGYGVLCAIIGGAIVTGTRSVGGAGSAILWMMSGILALEMALIGGRVVRAELREQTLGGLAGLPLAMSHVMMMKLNGARRALAPALVWMCVGGALMLGDVLVQGGSAGAASQGAIVGTLLLWGYFASQAWLLAHLAAYFSVRLKWGALPVAFAVLFASNLVGLVFCIGIFVMPIIALTYVPQLRTTIYQQLEQLAGEN
ncbi:MAG: hypothetical protein ABMA13_23910 [Chthoniobacteraceae bacterium]